ncbi:hypothetical protein INS49_003104 [Diaporthe citri]|uniref:uncharacterized protein n=1 Tax=Diaporthe citri TaxID=83186 RepID=UPI001C7F0B4C|nr:uncharacterized protein INS49_003104 [Diaporthe citri]KAG6368886.1 hypothetical protein INS49_003104 [Diaporthe citri]
MAQNPTSESVEGCPDNVVVRLNAVPALVEWVSSDGQTTQLGDSLSASPVSLDMTFDSTAKSIFLRLRITVQIHRDSSNKTPLYLHIGPEDIEIIACQGAAQSQATPTQNSFEIRLRRSVALIGPPFRLRPSNKARASVVNAAKELATRREFSIHVQNGLLSEPQFKAIREAVYSEYHSSGAHLDLASLYGGLGGKQIVARDADIIPAPDDGTEAPPSYDEVEAPPPMAPLWQASDPGPSSKKRRLSSSAADATASLLSVETICRKLMAEQQAKTEQSLRAMEDRLTTHLDNRYDRLQKESQEARDELSRELSSKMSELQGQVNELKQQVDGLNENMVEELEKLSEEIQVVSDDIDSRVDFRVDDTAVGFKIELEEFIRDELKDVEEAVKGSLRRANGHATSQYCRLLSHYSNQNTVPLPYTELCRHIGTFLRAYVCHLVAYLQSQRSHERVLLRLSIKVIPALTGIVPVLAVSLHRDNPAYWLPGGLARAVNKPYEADGKARDS